MAWSAGAIAVSLCLAGTLLGSPGNHDEEAPATPEQGRILQRMESYAARYMASLPDFICEQVTYQWQARIKSKRWHKGDTLTSKLAFNQGREERTLELINNKPATPQKLRNDPLITEGEFGAMMEVIFREDSHTDFGWAGWQTWNGQRVAVFTYSIDKQHSTLKLGLTGIVGAIVPYRGSIFADPETGGIRRITYVPHEIPPELETESISTTIDYDSVKIGGESYLLPSRAVVEMVTPFRQVRNEMEFRNYRKFEAESKITFGSGPEQRAPTSPD